MTRRAYIAGPMRGCVNCNFPAFDDAARAVRALGWEAVSPAEHDRDGGFLPHTADCSDEYLASTGFSLHDALRWDIGVLIDPATTDVVLLPGWSESRGATLELSIAGAVGLRVHHFRNGAVVRLPDEKHDREAVHMAGCDGDRPEWRDQ